MKQLLNISLLLFLMIFTSCNKKSGTQDENSYSNDFESMGYWGEFPLVTKSVSHSGLFATFSDSTYAFSQTFTLNKKDLKLEKPKKLYASVWVLAKSLDVEGQFVLAVDNDVKSIAWAGTETKKIITSTDTWYKLECRLDIPKEFKEGNKIKMYGWNKAKNILYWDDFTLKIE